MKSPEQNQIIVVHHDKWRGPEPKIDLLKAVKEVRLFVESPGAREAFSRLDAGHFKYAKLRYVLFILSKSKPLQSRRLTWRERITGVLSQ